MAADIEIAGRKLDPARRARLEAAVGKRNLPTDAFPVDRLAGADNEAEFLEQLIQLMQAQDAARTADFRVPAQPGWWGVLMGRIRTFLWKLLRYQHDVMAEQHNAVHALHTGAITLQGRETGRRLAELEARITRLEQSRDPETR